MPNWVSNCIVITGPKETLELFCLHKLNFNKFHPRPEEENENWYDWNVIHWGTKWEPVNLYPVLSDDKINIEFDTAWSPPTAFLTYLTDFFTGVKIINTFVDEAFCFAGYTVMDGGVALEHTVDPTDYTFESLRAFSKMNSWFKCEQFELMVHSLNSCDAVVDCACLEDTGLKTDVQPKVVVENYKAIVDRMTSVLQRIKEKATATAVTEAVEAVEAVASITSS